MLTRTPNTRLEHVRIPELPIESDLFDIEYSKQIDLISYHQ